MTRRKLPPFARELGERLQDRASWPKWAGTSPDGANVAIWVLVGADAWSVARQWRDSRLITLLPPGENPSGYDWRRSAGNDPVLIVPCGAVSDAEIHDLAAALLRDGARRALDLETLDRYEGVPDAA